MSSQNIFMEYFPNWKGPARTFFKIKILEPFYFLNIKFILSIILDVMVVEKWQQHNISKKFHINF